MYETHFGLSARPFPEAPRPDYYFPAQVHEQSRESIVRCLTRGSGTALLLGGPGTGKSMLCERVAYELQSRFPIVNLNWGHPQSCRGLLQGILYKLDLPYRNLDEGELRLQLIDHVTRSANCPHGMVLIVDEAHALSSELLNELRTLTNVVANGESCVRLILAGQMSLEETLSLPSMQSLQQRIAVRCAVSGFRREETSAFVRQALARCGGIPNGLFAGDTLSIVHELTEGVPRLVSQLCDHTLIMASIDAESQVTPRLVHEAWADLQQLPIVLEAYRRPHLVSNDDDVLEFGSLDSEEECETSIPIRPAIRIKDESIASLESPTFDPPEADHQDQECEFIEELSNESTADFASIGCASQPPEVETPVTASGTPVNVPADLFGNEFVEVEPVDDRYTFQSLRTTSCPQSSANEPTILLHDDVSDTESKSNDCPAEESAPDTPNRLCIGGASPILETCNRLAWSVVSTHESPPTHEAYGEITAEATAIRFGALEHESVVDSASKPFFQHPLEDSSILENKGSYRRLFSKLEAKGSRDLS
ncbi:MAG: AAA family ATPase [Planctomycetota bacterium]|nr:AAA family ATPase [Planctomycetota bacterium]MDA1178182.1 AAA family ATPase [Planctomycetota bacterium]